MSKEAPAELAMALCESVPGGAFSLTIKVALVNQYSPVVPDLMS